MTTSLNYTCANNCTWSPPSLTLTDDAGAALALPESVEIKMQLRSPASSSDIALEASIANGRIAIKNILTSEITIEVAAADMARVQAGNYDVDIIVKEPSGRVYRPAAGTVIVTQGVTR